MIPKLGYQMGGETSQSMPLKGFNFFVDLKKDLAVCKLCQCIFVTKEYGRNKFFNHIEFSHSLNPH